MSREVICNTALSYLSVTENTINNLDDDTTVEAQIMRLHYVTTIRNLLSEHDWNFARKYQALVKRADTDNEYDLPNDSVAIRGITEKDKYLRFPYQVRGKIIITGVRDPYIRYTQYDSSSSADDNYPSYFTQCLSISLATAVSIPLTANSTNLNLLLQWYSVSLNKAKQLDSRERYDNVDDIYPTTEWDMARK